MTKAERDILPLLMKQWTGRVPKGKSSALFLVRAVRLCTYIHTYIHTYLPTYHTYQFELLWFSLVYTYSLACLYGGYGRVGRAGRAGRVGRVGRVVVV